MWVVASEPGRFVSGQRDGPNIAHSLYQCSQAFWPNLNVQIMAQKQKNSGLKPLRFWPSSARSSHYIYICSFRIIYVREGRDGPVVWVSHFHPPAPGFDPGRYLPWMCWRFSSLPSLCWVFDPRSVHRAVHLGHGPWWSGPKVRFDGLALNNANGFRDGFAWPNLPHYYQTWT